MGGTFETYQQGTAIKSCDVHTGPRLMTLRLSVSLGNRVPQVVPKKNTWAARNIIAGIPYRLLTRLAKRESPRRHQ